VVKNFLKQIFCGVGANSPYKLSDFVNVLLDAVEHTDFTNNTCVRVGCLTGETVFSRLKEANFEKINRAFLRVLRDIFVFLKRLFRNRKVGLAFDTTDEPFYGKVEGLWIHSQKPVRGTTGCFKYITVSCTDGKTKFVLGSLPVKVSTDIVRLVEELLRQAQKFVHVEIALFDRGFDDYRLVEKLQELGIRYQILWRKNKWTTKVFKKMKCGEIKEINREGTYSRDKTTHKVNLRFVLIKKYQRYKNTKAYNWVFCTNTRQKWAHNYVDKYKTRWNIETTFRVLDNIQIKTTTKNEIIRYFINMFCCLIYNLWKLTNILEYKITLKNFVVKIIKYVQQTTINQVPDG